MKEFWKLLDKRVGVLENRATFLDVICASSLRAKIYFSVAIK